MNNSMIKASLLAVTLCASAGGWAFGPCLPIAKACMQQGHYSDKKALVKECVLPVVMGKKTLPNTSFSPKQIMQCKGEIKQKMQEKLGSM